MYKLYVFNLPLDASEEAVRKHFGVHGGVSDVEIYLDRSTGMSRGNGCVSMTSSFYFDTALRELDEELGLAVPRVDVLGLLDDYPTRSGYLITPVVLWARDGAAMRPNPQEVQSVHRIGLSQITRTDAIDFIDIPESPRKVVRVGIGERRIHAPTAAVLYQFRELLAGRVTRVDELEQPRFAWK